MDTFYEYRLQSFKEDKTITLCKFHSKVKNRDKCFVCKTKLVFTIESQDWRTCVLCVEEQAFNGMLEMEEEK